MVAGGGRTVERCGLDLRRRLPGSDRPRPATRFRTVGGRARRRRAPSGTSAAAYDGGVQGCDAYIDTSIVAAAPLSSFDVSGYPTASDHFAADEEQRCRPVPGCR